MLRLPDASRPLAEQPAEILLAMLLFGEARNQGRDGMTGVANAIRNRVHAPRNETGKRFGRGWPGVILRDGAFDCFRPSDPNYPKLLAPLKHEPERVWAGCLEVARLAIWGDAADNTEGATHYHDRSVKPWWAKPAVIEAGRMIPTVCIGDLHFYREP